MEGVNLMREKRPQHQEERARRHKTDLLCCPGTVLVLKDPDCSSQAFSVIQSISVFSAEGIYRSWSQERKEN
jgi:hypothetical protein